MTDSEKGEIEGGGTGGARRKTSRHSIGARRNPETEAAVLAAAEVLLREKGARGLTMEAVAKRARASKATLYRWWPSRGALLLAVYNRMKGEIDYPDTGSLLDDIGIFYDLVQRHWQASGGIVFAQIIAEAQGDPGVAEALNTYRRERQVQLIKVVERAIGRGELRAGAEAEALSDAIISLMWVRLLTGRVGQDGHVMARGLLQGWIRDQNVTGV